MQLRLTRWAITQTIKQQIEAKGGTFLKINWKKRTVHYLDGLTKKTTSLPVGVRKGQVVSLTDV